MDSLIVKYKNHINELQFKGFTSSDFDFFMYLCAKMKEKDEEVITVTLAEVRKSSGYFMHVSNSELTEILDSMKDKLQTIKAKFEDGTKRGSFVLFPTLLIDTKEGTLKVRVNPDFKYLLNNFTQKQKKEGFTKFELQEFVQLNSKYSKTIYRLLKQFRTTGRYEIQADELRKLLGCPDCYENKHIIEKIINPALEELKKDFRELKCEPIRAGRRGRPIVRYCFTFVPDSKVQNQDQPDGIQNDKPRRGRKPKKTQFSNFTERDYDFSELEKLVLS